MSIQIPEGLCREDLDEMYRDLEKQLRAALARVEETERLATTRGQNNRVLEADNADQIDRRRAAESRLAEATALLERCKDELDVETDQYSDPCSQQLVFDVAAFLSGTPAQAAEPFGGPVVPGQTGVPVYDPSCPRCSAMGKRCGICMHYVEQQEKRDAVQAAELDHRCPGGCVMSVPGAGIEPACLYCFKRALEQSEQSECHPAYCKHPFPWPNPDTTFDELKAAYESNTVALRDCREELELAKELLGAKHPRYREYWAQLESARAERDTALSDIFDYLVNIAHLEEENERWAGELHDEAGKREDLHKRLDTAMARIAELRANEVELSSQLEESHAETNSLKARIAELEQSEPVTPEQIQHALAVGMHEARLIAGDPSEHPDTIALRECRAELAQMQSQKSALARRVLELEAIKPLLDGLALESARAERDSYAQAAQIEADGKETMRAERDTALARIEELHAVKPLLDAEKLTAAEARIAELEQSERDSVEIIGTLSARIELARRQITPPLRTRAEVDAEIVRYIREEWFNEGRPVGLADSTRANLRALCAEPIAPEDK